MMFLNKNSRKILVAMLIFLSATLFCNVANANTLTDSVSSVFSFINKNVVAQIKNDFCRQYILAISSGEWKDGEFRTSLGKKVCTSYRVSSNSKNITQTTVQTLNGNSVISQTENPITTLVNNPTPDVYATNSTAKNSVLDTNQIVNLTNVARKDNDISLVYLKENKVLNNIAMIRTRDMFTNQYFEHNSPAGDNASKEAAANGYSYITIGENIALGNFDGTQGLITAWMNSPGHRANILNKNYTEIGVYAMSGLYKGQNVWIATQIFGKPMTGCKEPDSLLSEKVSKYKVSAESILTSIKKIDEDLKTINANDTQTYNLKIAERNTLTGLYNNLASEIKTLVAEYNKEAEVFNSCIKII